MKFGAELGFLPATIQLQTIVSTLLKSERAGQNIHDVADHLFHLPEKELWRVVNEQVLQAAESIRRGEPTLFFLVDKTNGGGPHWIEGLYDPDQGFLLGPPQTKDPAFQKGSFATALHAIEVFTRAVQLAQQGEEDITYPQLHLTDERPSATFRGAANSVLIPLTVHPHETNEVIVSPQADLHPKTFASAYYEFIQTQPGYVDDVLHHTMIVSTGQYNLEDRPTNKNEVRIRVVPHSAYQSHVNLNGDPNYNLRLYPKQRMGSWHKPVNGAKPLQISRYANKGVL